MALLFCKNPREFRWLSNCMSVQKIATRRPEPATQSTPIE